MSKVREVKNIEFKNGGGGGGGATAIFMVNNNSRVPFVTMIGLKIARNCNERLVSYKRVVLNIFFAVSCPRNKSDTGNGFS